MSALLAAAKSAPCDLCRAADATIACVHCTLDMCFPCAFSRHCLGTLTQHKFQFLPFVTTHYQALLAEATGTQTAASGGAGASPPAPQRARLRPNDLCQLCEVETNVLRCPTCDIRFCTSCADQFHSVSSIGAASRAGPMPPGSTNATRATWLNHKRTYEYCLDVSYSAKEHVPAGTGDEMSGADASASPAQVLSSPPAQQQQQQPRSLHQRYFNLAMQHARMSTAVTAAPLGSPNSASDRRRSLTVGPRLLPTAVPSSTGNSPAINAASALPMPSFRQADDDSSPEQPVRHLRIVSGTIHARALDFEDETEDGATSPHVLAAGNNSLTEDEDVAELPMPRFSESSPALGASKAPSQQQPGSSSRVPLQVSLDEPSDSSVLATFPSGDAGSGGGGEVSRQGSLSSMNQSGANSVPAPASGQQPALYDRDPITPMAATPMPYTSSHQHHLQQASQSHLHVNSFASPSTRSRSVMLASPPLSHQHQFALASPRKVAQNVSTFKLANFVLGYASSACPARDQAAFSIALDQGNQTVSVTSHDKEQGGLHYARHLSAIHSLQTDPTDPRRITILFRDSSRPLGIAQILIKIYTMSVSEGRMIQELLQVMVAEYDAPPTLSAANSLVAANAAAATASPGDASTAPSGATSPASPDSASASTAVSPRTERAIADTDIIYIGRLLKKGKMSWAPRWLVLKKFHLRVYKTNKLHVPSNNVSLAGCKIVTTPEKDKHLTIVCADRSYTFKCQDVIERDSVLQLMQKAMEIKRDHDGSISLSSIGGASPAPLPGTGPAGTTSPQRQHAGSFSGVSSSLNAYQSEHGLGGNGEWAHDAPRTDVSKNRRSTMPHRGGELINVPQSARGPSSSVGGGPRRGSLFLESNPAIAGGVHELDLNSTRSRATGSAAVGTGGLGSVGGANKRRSRRTISRDFHNVLSRSSNAHALTIDDASNFSLGGGGSGPPAKIEFAEFAIDQRVGFVRPSRTLNVGVYAFMRLLCESMQSGAHLSPTLYVPKSVWYQNGAKFQAFNAKLEVLETLRVQMLTIMPPPAIRAGSQLAVSAAAAAAAASSSVVSIGVPALPFSDDLERTLGLFRLQAEECQDKLAQHLSCIHTVKDSYRARLKAKAAGKDVSSSATGGSSAASGQSSSGGGGADGADDGEKMSLGEKLSKSMKTFGKIVSRAASASKDKVDHEDSTRYVKLLATVFDQSQVFHEWLLFLDSPYTLGDAHFPAQRPMLEEHLAKISEFFYCVLCNMVIRDLKSVLKRYIKHCVRNMTAH